jgi:hypothetical protein
VDTTLTVAAGTPTAGVQARITGAIKDVFDKAAGRATPEAPASIAYADLREAVTNIVPPRPSCACGSPSPTSATGRRARRRHRPGHHRPPRTAMPRKLTLRVEGSDG